MGATRGEKTGTPRVTTTKPRRCGSAGHYPMHCGTVTVRGATAEQVALADAAAVASGSGHATVTRDRTDSARWRVQQKPDAEARGGYRALGPADYDVVTNLTAEVSVSRS